MTLPLHVRVPSEVHVEAALLELAVLLGEGAGLAEEVDGAVGAGLLLQAVLGPHLGAVEAGVDAVAAREEHHQRVQRPARPARRRPPVDDLRDLPERDARAQARHATVAAVVEAVEEAGGPGGEGDLALHGEGGGDASTDVLRLRVHAAPARRLCRSLALRPSGVRLSLSIRG